MRRETKIGLLAIATLAVFVIGYSFLKGQDLFSSSNTYYVVYENVAGLGVGDAVTINGYRVGQVTDIALNPENVRSLTIAIRTDEDLPIPKNAGALIKSDGLLGGKFISLEFSQACNGANCAQDGDYLTAAQESVLAGLLGDPADLQQYTKVVRDAAGPVIDSIAGRLDTNGVGRTLRNTEAATANLADLTAKIDRLLARTSNDLASTTNSVAAVMKNLEDNNARIEQILRNVDSTTGKLAEVDLASTLDEVNKTLTQLQSTLSQSDGAIQNLNAATASLNSTEGTLGKLLKEDELHTDLERTLTNLDLLLQDFRLNPKRYVNVSVFGKKGKDYELPEDDPAKEIIPERE